MMQESQNRLDLLFEAVGDADTILILPHNDPDPDAIASAVALRHLLMEALNVESDHRLPGHRRPGREPGVGALPGPATAAPDRG